MSEEGVRSNEANKAKDLDSLVAVTGAFHSALEWYYLPVRRGREVSEEARTLVTDTAARLRLAIDDFLFWEEEYDEN